MRSVILAATAGAIFELWCLEAGCTSEPVNPNLSPEARQVFSYLESTYQKQVLAGYNVYVHAPDDYEQTGKQAAVWSRDIRWLGDVLDIPASNAPGFVIRDCVFEDHRARGLRIMASHGIIERNTFRRLKMSAITVGAEHEFWREAGWVEDVTIRDNGLR